MGSANSTKGLKKTKKEVLFKLAGNYYRGIEAKYEAKMLRPRHKLILEKEPDNDYDPYAIKVLTQQRVHIGYIPKMISEYYFNNFDCITKCFVENNNLDSYDVDLTGCIEFTFVERVSLDDKIKEGMTKEQCQNILGKEEYAVEKNLASGKMEILYYKTLKLTFKNGQLVTIQK